MIARRLSVVGEFKSSRRGALALMTGTSSWLATALRAGDEGAPIRMAISESVMGDVNLNDARAAMQIWMKRMRQQLNVVLDPKLFSTSQEIAERTRKGELDVVALNIVEYRPLADLFDPSQIVSTAGAAGLEQYIILVKQSGGIRQLGDLKGRRLRVLKTSKMCVAPAWLATILEQGQHGAAEQFFGSVAAETKFARVVLPVFFGQAEACLTTKRGFDLMCELNPQVGRDLKVLVSSPPMVVDFYIFSRNYKSGNRARLLKAFSDLRASQSGQQLASLFQLEELVSRDASCLASGLRILTAAERFRGRQGTGGQLG
ncbi:MAG: PhnD/SsuA/transferrin family substrate-binding protein [Bryobacterales bacterium]|nr:PhnD/SsuA/transferrin family substrate-binding protein [Bryobacterales bacterium]